MWQHGQVGPGGAVFPFADGLIGYIQDFSQFLLSEIMLFAQLRQFEVDHFSCLLFAVFHWINRAIG